MLHLQTYRQPFLASVRILKSIDLASAFITHRISLVQEVALLVRATGFMRYHVLIYYDTHVMQ